jgi:tRNASer (uridine44-2'-O)-methyltransferase
MLLWKDTYGPETIPTDPPVPAAAAPNTSGAPADAELWRHWPRPPGGFVDLGCGNGLLTHILISEGYAGHGFDLRARTSWTHYPRSTQSRLLVHALDPTAPTSNGSGSGRSGQGAVLLPTAPADNGEDNDDDEGDAQFPELNTTSNPDVLIGLLPAGCFLIGNHADELTPWVPLLATRFHASGYLSIPCCAWTLDARFDRACDVPLCAVDAATLNLGGGGGGEDGSSSSSSSYSLFRVWLAALSVHCGWAIEVEMLRIPSTRNWAIVGE